MLIFISVMIFPLQMSLTLLEMIRTGQEFFGNFEQQALAGGLHFAQGGKIALVSELDICVLSKQPGQLQAEIQLTPELVYCLSELPNTHYIKSSQTRELIVPGELIQEPHIQIRPTMVMGFPGFETEEIATGPATVTKSTTHFEGKTYTKMNFYNMHGQMVHASDLPSPLRILNRNPVIYVGFLKP